MVLGLGSWEIVVVGLALLVLFGPEHAPQAFRTLGRWQTRIRNTLQQMERTIEEETEGFEDADRIFSPSRRPPEAETWVLEDPDERYAQQESGPVEEGSDEPSTRRDDETGDEASES